MRYIDWLKTNPSKGYYWVKYSKDSEPSIDSFEEWYDRAGNIEIRFDCEPEYVLGPVLSYQEHLDIKNLKIEAYPYCVYVNTRGDTIKVVKWMGGIVSAVDNSFLNFDLSTSKRALKKKLLKKWRELHV